MLFLLSLLSALALAPAESLALAPAPALALAVAPALPPAFALTLALAFLFLQLLLLLRTPLMQIRFCRAGSVQIAWCAAIQVAGVGVPRASDTDLLTGHTDDGSGGQAEFTSLS